jgi:hypothetical protein
MKLLLICLLMILMGYVFLFFYFDWRLEQRRKAFKKRVEEFNTNKDEQVQSK